MGTRGAPGMGIGLGVAVGLETEVWRGLFSNTVSRSRGSDGEGKESAWDL